MITKSYTNFLVGCSMIDLTKDNDEDEIKFQSRIYPQIIITMLLLSVQKTLRRYLIVKFMKIQPKRLKNYLPLTLDSKKSLP